MIRRVLTLLAFCVGSTAAQGVRLPFAGRWFVMQGGDTPNVNYHMAIAPQAFAIDFAKAGGPTGRALSDGKPGRIEDFYGWGAEVLAPVGGVIVAAESSLPDNPLGAHDTAHPLGNHVILKEGPRYFYLAHFQQGSLRVHVGDHVSAGQPLARCGNSGNSDFPHVHIHATRSATFGEGVGENIEFSGVDVELAGKQFHGVDWPMIRGLWVSNP